MKRNKRINIKAIIVGIVYFIVAILIESANWLQISWDKMDFSTAIYQLTTPLKGTDEGIIYGYLGYVILAVIIRLVLVIIVFCVVYKVFAVLSFKFKLRVFRKNIVLQTGKKFYAVSKIFLWIGLIAISSYEIYSKVVQLGINTYIADMMEKSTIYEERYIDPLSVELTFPEKKRNLIFIYLESMETTYASKEAGGGKEVNYIPELVDLATEYVNISNTDSFGGTTALTGTSWTIAALLSTTSGVTYKIPGDGNSADRYAEFLPGICTLGDVLQTEGYNNYFMCGSEAEFAGRDVYFEKHGNYKVIDYAYAKETGLIPQDYMAYWGIEDAKLYDLAKQQLTDIANSGENFNFTLLTVDTHTPDGYMCDECENEYATTYENAIACSSKRTYEFVEWIQQQEWYENTTIILLGDHNSMKPDFWDDIDGYKRRTYNCFINLPQDVYISNVKNRDFTNLDIFPTTLSAIGVDIEGNRLGLGVNLFSDEMTLLEEMGNDELKGELKKYSDYYMQKFVKNE